MRRRLRPIGLPSHLYKFRTTLNGLLLTEVTITPLSPYLSFADNYSDAIAYYQHTLGAGLLYRISFGEMPKSAQDSAEDCSSGMQFPDTVIAHANVRITRNDIMVGGAISSGGASYSGFTLVLDSQQVERGRRWFDNLAANGKIEMAW